MIATVVSVREDFTSKGAEFKKVEVVDGQGKTTTKNIFDNLSEKWGLLEDGKTLDFKMEKKGQFWNVVDITVPTLKEAQSDQEMLPEHKEAVRKATEPNISDSELMKLRSMALAYSKDLACAHIAVGSEMKSTDIVNVAVIFASYIANGAMIVKEP